MAVFLTAGYSPNTNTLSITESFGSGGIQGILNITDDGSGNIVLSAGNSITTINSQQKQVFTKQGVLSVRITWLSDPHLLTITGLNLSASTLTITNGSNHSNQCNTTIAGCIFLSPFTYTTFGCPGTLTVNSSSFM